MRNKTTAAILALFLGAIGVHRFYLKQTGLGVIYIVLLFISGISFLVGIIDFVVFLLMSEEKFDEKYNTEPQPKKSFMNGNIENIADELEKLHILKEKGIITESEFQVKKEKLL